MESFLHYTEIYDSIETSQLSCGIHNCTAPTPALAPKLIRKSPFVVVGHCQYATALHGRYRGQIFCQHQRSSDSDELRSGETVRALLTHSDNDPLQQIAFCGAVQVGGESARAFGVTQWHTG